MTEQKKRSFIINVIYFGILGVIVYFGMKFTFKHLTPFIFGFLIAYALKPIVNRLTKQFGERNLIRIIVILIFYILVGLIIFGLVVAAISFMQGFLSTIPSFYESTLLPMITEANGVIEGFFAQINPELSRVIESFSSDALDALKGLLKSLSTGGLGFVAGFVVSVPSMLISTLIAIISSFFFTVDFDDILAYIQKSLPQKWVETIVDVKDAFVGTVGKYLIAYGKLMTLTFIELSVGFLIIGVSNPFGLAFLIAIVDILPVLGTGTIMIPWFILEFVLGNFTMGIALLIIYVIITVIRNILEPKVIGKQIGLHPIVTLICIYVGLRVAGFAGLFGFPIAVTIIKSLHDQGKINIFRNMKSEVDSLETVETPDNKK